MTFTQELNQWCLEQERRLSKLEVMYSTIQSNQRLLLALTFANMGFMGTILGAVLLK